MCAYVARELRHREARAAKRGGARASLRLREVTDLFPTLSESAIRAKVKERLPDVEAQRVRARPQSPCSPCLRVGQRVHGQAVLLGTVRCCRIGCKSVPLGVLEPQRPQLYINCSGYMAAGDKLERGAQAVAAKLSAQAHCCPGRGRTLTLWVRC